MASLSQVKMQYVPPPIQAHIVCVIGGICEHISTALQICSHSTSIHTPNINMHDLSAFETTTLQYVELICYGIKIIWSFRFSSGSVSVCTHRISIVVYHYFRSSNNRNPSTGKSKNSKQCIFMCITHRRICYCIIHLLLFKPRG